ncbi:hypothetical protein P280DRAFT_549634 [Massarina eburnea CBS 473.64]|uniref:Arrestin-like N-terminal domain-containing protein n=1 Tax=Massarina eburnea CBS 473.64 TaxID=1395130 RepID=A0A6A6RZT8_9PLEO|nr:hypothetical protein P280DRAFT_549634 [Massarina eburnea CBS 473.64]
MHMETHTIAVGDRTNHPSRPIHIALQNPNQTYTTDSIVRGKIRLDPKTRPSRITVTFIGRTRAAITRRDASTETTYKTKPILFSNTLELFASESIRESSEILKLGVTIEDRVELPFEFRFPERTPKRGVVRTDDQFNHQEGSELPPSFLFIASSGISLTNGDQQSVEYILDAKIYNASKATPSEVVRCHLRFLPPASANTPDSSAVVRTAHRDSVHQPTNGLWIRTNRLDPAWDPDEGLLDRIKNTFRSKTNAPFANFNIKAKCPRVLNAEKPVSFSLVLEHLGCSDEIRDLPPIFIRGIRVRLLSDVSVRVPSHSFFSESEESETHTDKSILLDDRYEEDDGLLLYDGLGVTTKPLPASAVSAFKTYALGLDHSIEVKLWGECAKEKFEVTPLYGKIFIVPHRVERMQSGEREEAVAKEMNADAVPPTYQLVDISG